MDSDPAIAARSPASAGFTVVEMMVVVLITVLGFLALFHLQSGVMKATTNSWNLIAATHLAEHFLETVRLESVEWNNDTTQGVGQAQFHYLNPLAATNTSTPWMRAYISGTGTGFQMSNQAGKLIGAGREYDTGVVAEFPSTGANARNQRFCVQYRLTWLVANFLVRAEVRVMWPRDDSRAALFDTCPDGSGTLTGIQDDPQNAWGVTFTTTVMKNVFVST
jgi:Tfp pilus assembly protein PilE